MCFPSIITTALHLILSALLCLAGVHHLRHLLCFVQPNQASELQNALATAALCILLWDSAAYGNERWHPQWLRSD